MKDLGKSLFYLILVIVVIGAVIYCLDNYSGKPETIESNSNNVVNNTSNNSTNKENTNNTINSNSTDKNENNKESNAASNTNKENSTNNVDTNNKTQSDNKNENNTNKNEQPKTDTEVVPITGEKKAIDLAKKEFGITEGVYYNCEKTQSNNVYIVSVRDEDTRALAWYTVDVVNETVK